MLSTIKIDIEDMIFFFMVVITLFHAYQLLIKEL